MTPDVTTDSLQAENILLHQQIAQMQEQEQRQQSLLQQHHLFDLHMISASNFRELVHVIRQDMQDIFEYDVVTLVLIDANYEIRRVLTEIQLDVAQIPGLSFLDAPEQALSVHRGFPLIPYTGLYDPAHHQTLFGANHPAQVAILPLRRQHQTIGYLCLGSSSPVSARTNMPVTLLERLASIMTICLENVLSHERLRHLGLTDSLTGIPNRRYIEQRLREEVARAQRERSPLSCLYIDLDYFKQVNDTFGHASGDIVLRTVSARIRNELRASDAVGRFGGEEFIVLLADTGVEEALLIGERIRNNVSDEAIVLPDNSSLTITVSIGIATLGPEHAHASLEALRHQLVDYADKALYEAKTSGRNQIVLAEELTIDR